MSAYTILVVDDVYETAHSNAELLCSYGYRAFAVTSAQDALEFLERHRTHLVLLDLWLDQNDPINDGLDLAERIHPAIAKIIVTQFPNYDPRIFRGSGSPQLVVDYVCKKDGQDLLVERVRQALMIHVPINWNLNVRWNDQEPIWQRLSFARLADIIEPPKVADAQADQELSDLLCMLFKDYQQIDVERVLAAQYGQAFLEVRATGAGRANSTYFVVYGLSKPVLAYEHARSDFAPRDSDARALHLEHFAKTPRYAAYAYTISGLSLRSAKLIGDYYRTADAGSVTAVLDHLLTNCLRSWTRASITLNAKLAEQFYQDWLSLDSGESVEQRLRNCYEALASASLNSSDCPIMLEPNAFVLALADGSHLRLPLPTRALNVPFMLAESDQLVGTLYGALDRDMVLVDDERLSCALMAFDYTVPGPLCADYASLEHWLRLQLSTTVRLETRLRCEELLLNMPWLTATPDIAGLPGEASKLMRAILRVRFLAAKESPIRDVRAYNTALLFVSLRYLLRNAERLRDNDSASTLAIAHSLICASLIYRKLMQGRSVVQVVPKELLVIIEERKVHLPQQLFRLFEYLFAHNGKVCTKQELLQNALGNAISADLRSSNGQLQNLISRLRDQLDRPNQAQSYLATVTNVGYRLNIPLDEV